MATRHFGVRLRRMLAKLPPARLTLARLPLALLPALLLAACSVPPDSAYVAGRASRKTGSGIALGNDAAGKACEQQSHANGEAYIFCGEWAQPSAHVSSGPPGVLADLATASAWRSAIDHRYDCAPPRPSSMLGDEPALVMDCTRKIGGWPQVAVVVMVSGKAYFADGLQPELPAIERSIGILSGRLAPEAAASAAGQGGSQGLAAERLAAQSFSSNDIGQYEQLMAAGAIANRTQNYISAEKAYRAAYALQQKILGPNNPNTASPLMHQAVQLSNQGRYPEADALFARAQPLVNSPDISDKAAKARLAHYRALNMINQDKLPEALGLCNEAEADYSALLPPRMLTTRAAQPAGGAAGALAEKLADQDLLTDPVAEAALMGVIEMRRNRANIYKWMGRLPESKAEADSATELARARGWSQPVVVARLLRTSAEISRAEGHDDAALSALSRSAAAFNRYIPGARPGADTELLRAAVLMRTGRADDALGNCRDAKNTLQSLKAGTTTSLIEPCLAAYAEVANQDPARRQALLTEMFEAAQLGQSGITSQQIARASARLAENARDPRVGEAIRRREDASTRLAELYRERDTAEEARRSGVQPNADAQAALDKKITEALAAEADADTALQVASPNYGQLVQQVVRAQDVMSILRPGEAFVATVLGDTSGWAFLLRDGKIAVSPIEGGAQRMGELVARARAGIEPTSGSRPPAFDTQAALALYNAVLGGLGRDLVGATSLTVVPSGPLLAYPFAALLTGPADPNALADAPWLIRQMTVTHVPAAANFVALRKIAGGSQAHNPWFGFGDFRPVSLKQAQASFPPGTCAEIRPAARRPAAAARRARGADPGAGGNGRRARRRTARPRLHRRVRAPGQPAGLSRAALRHPCAAADRSGLPGRTGDRCLRPAGCTQRLRRIAHGVRGGTAPARRRRDHPLGLQHRWPERRGCGREPFRPGAQLLLCRRPLPAGHPLAGERPDHPDPGGEHAEELPGEHQSRSGRGTRRRAARADRAGQGRARPARASVLLGTAGADRREQPRRVRRPANDFRTPACWIIGEAGL